jgi:hypothetical protein
MPFTKQTAADAGRRGGQTTLSRYGVEHYRRLGKKGFAGLARKLGFVGGHRRRALQRLIASGRLIDRYPDQGEACRWAESVLEALDPANPEVPY